MGIVRQKEMASPCGTVLAVLTGWTYGHRARWWDIYVIGKTGPVGHAVTVSGTPHVIQEEPFGNYYRHAVTDPTDTFEHWTDNPVNPVPFGTWEDLFIFILDTELA